MRLSRSGPVRVGYSATRGGSSEPVAAWVWPVKSGAPDVDNLDPKEYKLPPTEPLGGARLGKFGIIGLCGQEEHGSPVEWYASPVPA